jgi:hypothetical protein
MIKNPYSDSESLAELLWETEMVADRFSNGGLILIRTKDGWRAFLGTLEDDVLREMEKSLDKNVPNYEQAFGEISRKPNLIDEFHRFLPNCMCFPGYRPMKFIDDLGGDE